MPSIRAALTRSVFRVMSAMVLEHFIDSSLYGSVYGLINAGARAREVRCQLSISSKFN